MDQALNLIKKNNGKKLKAYLTELEDIKPHELVDKDGFTLLHHAVSRNKIRAFESIFEVAKEAMF